MLKKYSAARENTQSFELSCMKEILAEELATLMEPGHFLLGPALIKGHPPTKKLAAFLTKTFGCDDGHVFSSAAAKLLAGKAYKGDVVLLKSLQGEPEAGQVWVFFEAPGFLGCLVNMFKLKQYNPSTVGGHKPKSFGSVGRCCGTNDLLPTCRRHQNFAAMALGQTKKHLKKKRR